MIHSFSASYECGCRLAAAGIPLDYLNDVPREADALRSHLYISPLGGDLESRVLAYKDGEVKYIISLRLATNLSRGVVISNWSLTTPWGHHINWDYHAGDVLPTSDHPIYAKLFNSPLAEILKERRHLSRGGAVDGLLCGCAFFQSIPSSIPNLTKVCANLSLTVDTGQVFAQDIEMIVERRVVPKIQYRVRVGRLLEKRDAMELENRALARPVPRPRRRQREKPTVREIRSMRALFRSCSGR